MFNIAEFKQKSDRLSDLLPWAAVVAPGVVLNKDGSFQRTIRFRGPDLASSTAPQLVAATARLNNALKRLGSGWAIFIEARRQESQAYPEKVTFPDSLSSMVENERRESFLEEGMHFESVYHLTLQYLPPVETVSKMTRWFVTSDESGETHDYHKGLDFFVAQVTRILDILKDFMFEAHALDDDETLTYLHSCVSQKAMRVRMPESSIYLDGMLADTPLTGGLEPMLGDWHIRTVSILGFPTSSVPALLDQLNHLPIAYRWVTRFLPLDKTDAEKILKTYRRQWFAKRKGMMALLAESLFKSESALHDSAALRKSEDADAALQALGDDHVGFGYYTATITVWDRNRDAVDEKQREIERVVNGLGFTTIAERINAVEAWLSSLPGQTYANVRMPLMHTLNLSHLIPFSAIWAGPAWNRHLDGPPLFYARTTGNTPFRFSNHIQDVGHQMIIGPTGAGKSVLLNFMALQFRRYADAQVFIFDKGHSAYVTTLGVGGCAYEVGGTQAGGLVFAPLSHIDDEAERVWAQSWVLGLLENEGLEIRPDVKDMIWRALSSLAACPKQQRTLTGLKALVQDVDVRLVLDRYTVGGPFGAVLDADTEQFSDNDWQYFEMDLLMQMPEIIAPVLSYIFHVLEKRFDGRPGLMILDEAWLFLDHPIFAHQIRAWLKTLRKQNVSVVFATQSVDDALQSQIAPVLLESCPSRVFLPNDRALEPQITGRYEALGLNTRQIQIIAHATPKRQYYFESAHGQCLFDCALGPIALAFCGASTPEALRRARAIYQRDTGNFLTAYLSELGLVEEVADVS